MASGQKCDAPVKRMIFTTLHCIQYSHASRRETPGVKTSVLLHLRFYILDVSPNFASLLVVQKIIPRPAVVLTDCKEICQSILSS